MTAALLDRFATKSVDDIELAEVTWVIPGLAPLDGLTIVHGQPGAGKSTFALAMAMSVAQGCPFAGRDEFAGCFDGVPTQVVYLGTDSRWQHELKARSQFYAAEHRGNLRVLDARAAGLTFSQGLSVTDVRSGWTEFGVRCQYAGVRLVVIDHLLGIASARDVNSGAELAPVLEALNELIDHGVTPVLLHHQSIKLGRSNPKGGMGHTVITASMRSGLSLTAPKKGDLAQTITVTSNEQPEMRLLIERLRGRPPVVLDFSEVQPEAQGAETKRTIRKKSDRGDTAIARARVILDGPDSCRRTQKAAGQYLAEKGLIPADADYRSAGRLLVDKELLAMSDNGLIAGPKWNPQPMSGDVVVV